MKCPCFRLLKTSHILSLFRFIRRQSTTLDTRTDTKKPDKPDKVESSNLLQWFYIPVLCATTPVLLRIGRLKDTLTIFIKSLRDECLSVLIATRINLTRNGQDYNTFTFLIDTRSTVCCVLIRILNRRMDCAATSDPTMKKAPTVVDSAM